MNSPTLASLAGRRALTVCQPYASALIMVYPGGRRLKIVENRTWPTNFRGPLLIHAGKSHVWTDDYESVLFDPIRIGRRFTMPSADDSFELLPMGAILGQVTLVDCVSTDAGRQIDPGFASGPWCWVMDDPISFDTPIPCLGAQGLWNVLSTSAPAPRPTPALPPPATLKPQTSRPKPDTTQLDLFSGCPL